MQCPKAALFDVDDTLAESFQPPAASTLEHLRRLLENMPIGIISAAGFPRIERQFADQLTHSPHASRLYVLPNSSAQAYTWEDGWKEAYNLGLTQDERKRISVALRESDPSPDPRALVLDREVQVAYAAIGLDAALEEKLSWDPRQEKRREMKRRLEERLPEFEILIGGMTTIDITRKGINKAYGVRWLAERLHCTPREMLYVGDALYEGGNDAVVIPTGIETRQVTGPKDTERVIDEVLAACSAQ